MYPVMPQAVNGLTVAQNDTVTSAVKSMTVTGPVLMVSVGSLDASAYPVYIMFGGPNVGTSLTATTGFLLSAGWVGRITVPPSATTLYYLRAQANDSVISVLSCSGGM